MPDQNYYYVIPAQLIEGDDPPNKALLYGLIVSLSNKKGYCWASNQFLANKLGIKGTATVSRYISELVKEGWIDRKVNADKGNRRKLFIDPSRGIDSDSKTSDGKNQDPSTDKNQQSNISNSNNNKEQSFDFSFKQKLNELLNDDKDVSHLIGVYWRTKGSTFDLEEEYKDAFKRNLKPARKLLQRYDLDLCLQAIEAFGEVVEFSWTLETVMKYMPKFKNGTGPFEDYQKVDPASVDSLQPIKEES